jgi:trehalose-phosphatase
MMKPLDPLLQKIQQQEKIVLMFDYDGTLTPIVETPEQAWLETQVCTALEQLAKLPWVKIAIVSGRSVQSVLDVSKINSNEILFFGLHGGEIFRKGKYTHHATDQQQAKINAIKTELQKAFHLIKGVKLEDKGCAIAVHFRMVTSETLVESIQAKVLALFWAHNQGHYLRLQAGKKVLEILPASFNKATAVETLHKMFPTHYPIYCGDDLTDIPALKAVLKYQGFSVGVGAEAATLLGKNVSTVVSIETLSSFILSAAQECAETVCS